MMVGFRQTGPAMRWGQIGLLKPISHGTPNNPREALANAMVEK
jgi:hypothetical protein